MLSNLTFRFGPSRRFELTVCVNTLCEMDSLSAKFGSQLFNLYFDRKTGQLVADDMLTKQSAPITDDRGQQLIRNPDAPVSVSWGVYSLEQQNAQKRDSGFRNGRARVDRNSAQRQGARAIRNSAKGSVARANKGAR